jgi:uridine kinase
MFKIFPKELYGKLEDSSRSKQPYIVAIDGPSAAGKSTLAEKIKKSCEKNVQVIHKDDFYLPSNIRDITNIDELGGDFDYKRLILQVLEPLSRCQSVKYQRYDWEADALSEWVDIKPNGIVIIEGCFSLRDELIPFFDFLIWVDAPKQVSMNRVAIRDSQGLGNMHLWMTKYRPNEELYISVMQPAKRANLIIDGAYFPEDESRDEI